MVINKTASLPLKDLRILQHMLPSFSFPVVGMKREERENTNKQKSKAHTNSSLTLFRHQWLSHGSIYKSSIYNRVRYVQEVPQPFTSCG